MKNYIGISRDHSASMSTIATAAKIDYNNTITAIAEAATENGVDTVVSVVKSGVGVRAQVIRDVINSSVQSLKPLSSYVADGHGTPLFDSVGDLIEQLESVPDADKREVSFVVMAVTDGQENCSVRWNARTLGAKMKQLQATDRWTFIFRVPRGGKQTLIQQGVPEGNILEWEQSAQGVQAASAATTAAFRGFYQSRAAGATSTTKFYADLSQVTLKEVKSSTVDISKNVVVYEVDAANDGVQIRDFVNDQGVNFTKGCAFYELKKTETVQGYKQIAIREINTGKVFSGFGARDLLGLPHTGDVKVAPGAHSNYEIYVQSTSVNRKLTKGMGLMIWEGAPA